MSFSYFLISAAFFTSLLFAAEKTERVNLDAIWRLAPEQLNKKELTKLFGKPNELNSESKQEVWKYKQNGRNRIMFFFEEASNAVSSWIWNVHEGDPEKNLGVAKKKFQSAEWQAQTEKWINPHAFPMECYYKDEKVGVSLTYNLVRREVSAVSRWNPMRKIASDTDEKPPEYCIGNGCASAIAAKEFFKDKSVEKYCEEVR